MQEAQLRPNSGLGNQWGQWQDKYNHAKKGLTGNDFFGRRQPERLFSQLPTFQKMKKLGLKYQAACVISNITQLVRLPDCQCGNFLITPSFRNWTGLGLLPALEDSYASISHHVWAGVTPRPPLQFRNNDKKWWNSCLRIALPVSFQQGQKYQHPVAAGKSCTVI